MNHRELTANVGANITIDGDNRVVECLVDSGHMSINRDAMYHDGGEQ